MCLSVCLSVNASVCQSVSLSINQSIWALSVFGQTVCTSDEQSACLSCCPSSCLSFRPSICPSTCLPVCPPVCPTVCPSANSSVCLTINQTVVWSVQLSVWSLSRSIIHSYCRCLVYSIVYPRKIQQSILQAKICFNCQYYKEKSVLCCLNWMWVRLMRSPTKSAQSWILLILTYFQPCRVVRAIRAVCRVINMGCRVIACRMELIEQINVSVCALTT